MGRTNRNTVVLIFLGVVSLLILLVGIFCWGQTANLVEAKRRQVADTREQCLDIIAELRAPEIAAGKLTRESINVDALRPDDLRPEKFSAPAHAREELESLDAMLVTLSKNLMDYAYIPTYLAQIEQTATTTGNRLVSISPGEIKQIDFNNPLVSPSTLPPFALGDHPALKETAAVTLSPDAAALYRVQQIGLNVKGTYTSIIKLLNALRKFPQLMYVKSLTLTPGKVKDAIVITVGLQTYALILPDQNLDSALLAIPPFFRNFRIPITPRSRPGRS